MRRIVGPAPDGLAAAEGDRLEDADRHQIRDHRRAADAHEREWNSRDRSDSDRHPDVHERLEEQAEDDRTGSRRLEGASFQGMS